MGRRTGMVVGALALLAIGGAAGWFARDLGGGQSTQAKLASQLRSDLGSFAVQCESQSPGTYRCSTTATDGFTSGEAVTVAANGCWIAEQLPVIAPETAFDTPEQGDGTVNARGCL